MTFKTLLLWFHIPRTRLQTFTAPSVSTATRGERALGGRGKVSSAHFFIFPSQNSTGTRSFQRLIRKSARPFLYESFGLGDAACEYEYRRRHPPTTYLSSSAARQFRLHSRRIGRHTQAGNVKRVESSSRNHFSFFLSLSSVGCIFLYKTAIGATRQPFMTSKQATPPYLHLI